MHTAFIATVESCRQDRASQASKGPLFCVIEGRTNVLRRQCDCYGEALSAAARRQALLLWRGVWCCAAALLLKSKLVAFSFSKPVLCSCTLHSVPSCYPL